MTDNYLLAPATPAALSASTRTEVPAVTKALPGTAPAYLVWSREAARLDELDWLLFRDGNMALVQADAATAQSISQRGFQILALPANPAQSCSHRGSTCRTRASQTRLSSGW